MPASSTKDRTLHAPEQVAVIDRFLRPQAVGMPLIRLGDFGDGGYLVPEDLRGIAACYSPGVSEQATFEMDLAKRGIRSFMADASVEKPPLDVPGADFVPKFLGPRDEGDTMSLLRWVEDTDPAPGEDLILQMDIEGAEYATLAAAPRELLRRFRMIVIEWHHLPSVLTKPRFQNPALAAVEKLKDDFVTVHLHANNVSGSVEIEGEEIPRVVEATLLRRDRIGEMRPVEAKELPHPLDCRHNPRRPWLSLPQRWLGADG
ncbi:hypothetical protein ROG8370_03121 [Roseovarius gaetbuli]|uniref:Methyltransferase FkbM domain-containing protein n=1 Tax=Roseovarius gaetbuli TaxID=1356575 RepID=A0A1X7A0I6_9RHOB|nr:FkbM family methyltransferase [Roseovarius gaetbuli]SLN66719.1 hypothetical protein ROG8370_03121 [Roseovarius gaetbuli]